MLTCPAEALQLICHPAEPRGRRHHGGEGLIRRTDVGPVSYQPWTATSHTTPTHILPPRAAHHHHQQQQQQPQWQQELQGWCHRLAFMLFSLFPTVQRLICPPQIKTTLTWTDIFVMKLCVFIENLTKCCYVNVLFNLYNIYYYNVLLLIVNTLSVWFWAVYTQCNV